MLTQTELDNLLARCRLVPLTTSVYRSKDAVLALLETVVDYQMHTTAVERALQHFERERSAAIGTMDDLRDRFAHYPDTKEGNTELAQYLWGYRLWTRAHQLRDLVAYFDGLGISTLQEMQTWASQSTFEDFEGRVKGLGETVYHWLVMRLGVETVKPDVHVLRFVNNAIGRQVSEADAVLGLEQAAKQIG